MLMLLLSPLLPSKDVSLIPENILSPDMALENLHGRVAWLFDQIDFDVDQIVGVKNIKIKDPDELARLAMAIFNAHFEAL